MARAYRRIAYLNKTHSKQGRLVASPLDGLPFLLEAGMEVFIVPPRITGPRSYRVSSVQAYGNPAHEQYLVSFDGLEDRAEAESLVSRYCLVDAACLAAPAQCTSRALEGFTVIDQVRGAIGQVREIVAYPQQELLLIEGERTRHLVPFVDDFIVSIDEEARRLILSLPEGLMELGEACSVEGDGR